MIVDERFTTYLRSLDTPEIDYIADIEQEALQAYVPSRRRFWRWGQRWDFRRF